MGGKQPVSGQMPAACGLVTFVCEELTRVATAFRDFSPAARCRLRSADWQAAVVGDLAAAEEMLDHLEACGCRERELKILGDSRFEVRWR